MGYIYLAFAILLELGGTTCLKYAAGFTKPAPSAASLVLYGACFYMLSKSLTYINLSTAYATWCGVGIAAAALISVFIFGEKINVPAIAGIAMITGGVVILNLWGTAG